MKVFAHIDKLRCSVLAIMVVTAFPVFASLPRHRFLNGDTRYTYDALNRLVSRSVPSVPSVDRFSYDAVGNLLTASNETARLAFSYDAMNRLVSSETRVAGQVFGVSYAYDLGGLCTNVVYPGGRAVRYGYDADGRVTHVSDWLGHTWAFTRDAAGRLTALSCPNGVTGAWTYDANHAVASWSWSACGSPFAGRVITRDEAGIKTKEQVTAGLFPNPQNPRRAINTFDAADRLVSATVAAGTNTYAETYLYDLNGALTNKQSAIGNERYEYDCAGRLSYLQLLNPNSSLLLAYDAIGNRIVCGDRIWITDHADPRKRPLIEADVDGVPVRYFVWGGGMLLAVVEADGTMRYCHSDEQGSIVALTDGNGDVTDQFCYGPYGADWGRTGTNSIPFRWLGSHGVFNVGGSALHLTRYRAYDASLCRFLSSDPLGLGGGPNLYAYCVGNPLAYIDPLGLGAEVAYVVVGDGWGAQNVANAVVSVLRDLGWQTSQITADQFADLSPETLVDGLVLTGHGDGTQAANIDVSQIVDFLNTSEQQLDLCVVLSCHGNEFANELFNQNVLSQNALSVSYWGYSMPAPVRNYLMKREIRRWNANKTYTDVNYGNLIQDGFGTVLFDGIVIPISTWLSQ